MTQQQKENRKIFHRFLKECGLYAAWKEYVRKVHFYYDWNKNLYVDDIFAYSEFGTYMSHVKGMPLSIKLGPLCREYVRLKFGKKNLSSHYYHKTGCYNADIDMISGIFETE